MKAAPLNQSKLSMLKKEDRMQFSLSLKSSSLLPNKRWPWKHYGQAMDIEWAKDGDSGKIFIVQARPETLRAAKTAMSWNVISSTPLAPKILCEGRSIGQRIGSGKVRIVNHLNEMDKVRRRWRTGIRHDRSRLGTSDEALRLCHRHQPWWSYLSRSDYRAWAWCTSHCWLW